MGTELIFKLLKLAAEYDFTGNLIWSEDLEFGIICNDFFAPAADAEYIKNEDDLKLLEQSMKDMPHFGELLYCARRRKLQPQKGYFDFLKKDKERFQSTLELFEKVN